MVIVLFCFSDQSDQKQKYEGSDNCRHNMSDNTTSDPDVELREQPVAQKTAQDTDHDIAQQPESISLADKTGKPAGCRSDDQDDDKSIQIHVKEIW